ncbi:hypothetical protein ACWDV4_11245 [Micromonospora sp. NPDC003197]
MELTRNIALLATSLWAVASLAWAVFVLVTGRAPQRWLAPFPSARAYAYHWLLFGAAFGFLAVAQIVPPGPVILVFVAAGLGLMIWLNQRGFRLPKEDAQRKS